jgi:hypothetical protein
MDTTVFAEFDAIPVSCLIFESDDKLSFLFVYRSLVNEE